jgi:hypothetical protein
MIYSMVTVACLSLFTLTQAIALTPRAATDEWTIKALNTSTKGYSFSPEPYWGNFYLELQRSDRSTKDFFDFGWLWKGSNSDYPSTWHPAKGSDDVWLRVINGLHYYGNNFKVEILEARVDAYVFLHHHLFLPQ